MLPKFEKKVRCHTYDKANSTLLNQSTNTWCVMEKGWGGGVVEFAGLSSKRTFFLSTLYERKEKQTTQVYSHKYLKKQNKKKTFVR